MSDFFNNDDNKDNTTNETTNTETNANTNSSDNNDNKSAMDFREIDENGKSTVDDKDLSGSDKKDSDYEDICFICRRPESKAGRMYKLPNHICVCEDCMHRTMDTVSQYDYNNLLNNPELMNQLNKNSGITFMNLGDFGSNFQGGIPNSQKIKKSKKRPKTLAI